MSRRATVMTVLFSVRPLRLCVSVLLLFVPIAWARAQQPADPPSGLARVQLDAAALRPTVTTELARRFVDATSALPWVQPRTFLQDPQTRKWHTPDEAARLDEPARAALKERTLDEQYYYNTRYGTPLAYARALDLVASSGGALPRLETAEGRRILDYGYGGIGHLRLLASLGAHVVGLEVDPLLPLLYGQAGDTGAIPGADIGGKRAPDGSITLLHGRFPADEGARDGASARGPYDLIISKNTLKNGYVHPEKPVEKRLLVDLGVSDAEFVSALYDNLKPGGLLMIYNLCPAPGKEGEPYKHWADGRCPFGREVLEGAGLRVVEFDRDDSVAARAMARALSWDKDGMDVEADLFALFTLAQRPLK